MDIENLDMEWKECWSEKYLKTIAAFNNTKGGRMIIGRRDNGEYVGVKDIKGTVKAISDTIHNKFDFITETRAENIEGKDCIIIDVPHGDEIVDYNGKFYFRDGNTTQQVQGAPLKKILLEEMYTQWLDQPCDVDPEDISEDAFRFFMKKGKESGRIPENVPEDDMMLALKTMNLLSEGKLSLTAALLFTKNPDKYEYGAFLKIGLFDSKKSLLRDDILDNIPLVMLPDACMRVLNDKYIQPTYRYGTGTASRGTNYLYPPDAVRELVVNAIIHKDYSMKQEIFVHVYEDKLMIHSSGVLPEGITPEQLKGHHASVKRNKKLAEAFYAMKYVEGWGQGIEKVMSACRENGNPEPEFICAPNYLLAILRPKKELPHKSDNVDFVLDDKDWVIIDIMSVDPYITIDEIISKSNLSTKIVRTRIKRLSENNIISREGSRRTGKWIVRNQQP